MAKTKSDAAPAETAAAPIPTRDDPGFSDYCLSLLRPGEYVEKDDGKRYPKVVGLRRLVRLLHGEIVESRPVSILTPEEPYKVWAIVTYQVVVKDRLTGELSTYGEVGDVNEDNLSGRADDDMDFLKYAARTASTQAEGRALRKFLNLNVCAIEELTERKATTIEVGPEPMSDLQRKTILTFCRGLKLDADEFIAANSKGEKKLTRVDQLDKKGASWVINKLDQLNRQRPAVPLEI